MTPAQRHRGEDKVILAKRKVVMEQAKKANEISWAEDVRNCEVEGPVSLNPEKENVKEQQNKAA